MDYKKVYELTKKVPRGRVTTYGEIAKVIGGIRYAHAVGKILNKNSSPEVPCHRVVMSNGKVGGFRRGKDEKGKILRKEGIKIAEDRIIGFAEVLVRFQ